MKSVWHFKVFDKFFKTVDLTSVTDFADKGFLCALTWTSPDPPSMLQVLSSIGSAPTQYDPSLAPSTGTGWPDISGSPFTFRDLSTGV